MNVEKIMIQNFRLLKDFELDLKESLSLIVGKNNCGKTSILTIVSKLLDSSNNNVQFKWDDFNLEFQKEFYAKINNPTSEYSSDGIKMTLLINYSDSDSYSNLQNFMMDLNPENNTIVLEFFYSCPPDNLVSLKAELKDKGVETEEKFSKFMKKNSNNYFKLKVYSKGYDDEKAEILHEISAEVKNSEIKKLINCYIIKANRDASNQTNNHSLSNLSAKYYDLKQSKVPDEEIFDELAKTIEVADTHLNEIYNKPKSGIFSDIIENIGLFGGISGETKVSIQSSIESKELLKDNTTLYYEHAGRHLPENHNGLGYLNLISMIFEIETAIAGFHGKLNDTPADINLLFIEEPEAHTHPQLQYIFIKRIKEFIKKKQKDLDLQTILTTHSAHIVADCDFNDIRYLKREASTIKAMNFENLHEEYSDEQAFKFVKKYLTLNHSELFFADKVIFIEGSTERILLPAMMNKVDVNLDGECLPLLSQNISVIEVGTYSHKFKALIKFLGLKALVITDIDGVEKKIGDKKTTYPACPSSIAKYTSNPALKDFFDLTVENKHFECLTSKPYEDKVVDDSTRIAYQVKENDYHARSFEDAFLALNLEFIKYVLEKDEASFYESLNNKKKLKDENPDYYALANDCISGKSSFATDILYFDGLDGKEWAVPTYIKEGLEWLRKI